MMLVYLAHPLHGDGSPEWGDPKKNVERYLRFAAWASLEGCSVVSWVHHWLLQEANLTPKNSEFYLARDGMLILASQELWVCGPPEISSGVRWEIAFAHEHGIPVKYCNGYADPATDPMLQLLKWPPDGPYIVEQSDFGTYRFCTVCREQEGDCHCAFLGKTPNWEVRDRRTHKKVEDTDG